MIDYRTHALHLIQGENPPPSSEADQIKFKLAGPAKPLILVPTYVNDQGPYQFAVDTGASTTVISPEFAQSLGIQTVEAPAMTGGGGKVRASRGNVESLAVGMTQLEKVAVVVSDFLVSLSGIVGAKLDGVVGYNYLKNFTVTIDYPRETLTLQKA
ncbi:retropepsin-like domain-containing protein [Candidatus Acetothermia bacterium]|nr:retropepsin-like domain-containing protein [Candidatus Acetothermia bacterium]